MRLTLLALLFCLCQIDLIAQTETETSKTTTVSGMDRMPKRKDYNSWEVGIHGGVTYPNTDIAASDLNGKNLKARYGFGFHISKFFTHNFALQGQFIHARLEGVDNKDNRINYGYNTDVNYEATLNAVGHIGNIGFLKRTPKFGLYAYVGIGFMNISPTTTENGVPVEKNVRVQPSGNYERIDYNPTTELVIPFGVGIRYQFIKKFSAHLEYSLRTTRSDKLDGFYRILSDYDDYSYFSIGLTYHIGKKEKTIEWVNPLETIYSDLYDTKEKVDMMSGDKDKDGVADMFDKDNATPEGVKVYGDGTSVDTDGDGVPDYLDADPFSAKGAKVDAQGKELDSDADGIPDTRDLEPNTPKGTLVNNQGNTIATGPGTSSTAVLTGYIPSVFFDLNSAVITPKYYEMLADIALVLKNNPSLKFEIIGNCDVRATESYNNTLGQKRAEAVKEHLVKRYGIEDQRLSLVSKGKTDPITKDHAMNRRVDFQVAQ